MRTVSSCGGEGALVECEVVGDVMAVFGGEVQEWISGSGGLPGGVASSEGGGKRAGVEGAMDDSGRRRRDVVGCAQQWFGGSGASEGSHLRGYL